MIATLLLTALAHAEAPRCDLYDPTPSAKVQPPLAKEDAAALDRTCWMLVWTHGPGSPDKPDLASGIPMMLSGAADKGLLTGDCAQAASAVAVADPAMAVKLLAYGCPSFREAEGAGPGPDALAEWVVSLWGPTVERARPLLHPDDRAVLDTFWTP